MYKYTDTSFCVLISCSSRTLIHNSQHVRSLAHHDEDGVQLYTGYEEGHDLNDIEVHSFYIVDF
jgi:hypothetical protein